MLDIIYTLFQTLIHGIVTLLNMILSIPWYISYITGFVALMPVYIALPIGIVITASIVIGIKRLVL